MMCSFYHDVNTTTCLPSGRLCDNIYDVNFEKNILYEKQIKFLQV